jgi:hypothetical protein
MGKVLLEFPHENARLEALHLHRELEQLKIGLPFVFPHCRSKTSFKRSKG